MEKRHAKGPSRAIGTIVGALGGAVTGAGTGATVSGVPISGSGGIISGLLTGASGLLGGASVTGSAEVAPFIGISDNIGLWGNTVLGSLINSGLGSFGTSAGSLVSSISRIYFPSFGVSDSLLNSGVNSLGSNSVGPIINSLINLF